MWRAVDVCHFTKRVEVTKSHRYGAGWAAGDQGNRMSRKQRGSGKRSREHDAATGGALGEKPNDNAALTPSVETARRPPPHRQAADLRHIGPPPLAIWWRYVYLVATGRGKSFGRACRKAATHGRAGFHIPTLPHPRYIGLYRRPPDSDR